MTMTPSKFLIQDPMPSPGALVREAIQPRRDQFKDFEQSTLGMVDLANGDFCTISEKDCRQIKKKPRSEDALIKALTDCYITGNGAALIRYDPVKVEVFTKPVTIYQPPPSPAVVDGNPIPGLDEAIARQHNAAYFMWGVA